MFKLKADESTSYGPGTELCVILSENTKIRITNYSFDIYVNEERINPSEYCSGEFLLVDPITEDQYLDPAIFTNIKDLKFSYKDFDFKITYIELEGLHSMKCEINKNNIIYKSIGIWEEDDTFIDESFD